MDTGNTQKEKSLSAQVYIKAWIGELLCLSLSTTIKKILPIVLPDSLQR